MAAILALGLLPPTWPEWLRIAGLARLASPAAGSAFAIWAGRTLGTALHSVSAPEREGDAGGARARTASSATRSTSPVCSSFSATAARPAFLRLRRCRLPRRPLALQGRSRGAPSLRAVPRVRRLPAPGPARYLGRARGLSLRAIGATSGCRFATTARSPSARTIASMRSSSCPLTEQERRAVLAGRARTRRALPRRGRVHVGSAHSQTNFVSSASNRSADSAIRSFTSRKSASVRAIASSRCHSAPSVVRLERQRGTAAFGCAADRYASLVRAALARARRAGRRLSAGGRRGGEARRVRIGHADRRGRRPRRGLPARPDRQVDRRPLRRPARRRARPRRPARRPGEGRARGRRDRGPHRAAAARSRTATGFAPGAVAPFPLPKVDRVLIDQNLLAHDTVWVGAGSATHMAAPEPGRPRAARTRAADGRRPGLSIRFRSERRSFMRETETIWMNGEFVDWADAKVHVGVHGLHYGTGVFEGIRCYETPEGPAVFRLKEHLQRLDELGAAALHGAAVHGRRAPRGDARADRPQRPAGVLRPPVRVLRLRRARRAHEGQPGRGRDHELAVGQLPRRRERRRSGIRTKISSWKRVGPNTIPHAAKATGIYLNSMLAVHEAQRAGYDEAILLTDEGYVADGLGREHLRRQGRPHRDAAALDVDPARDHARQRDPDRAGPRLRGRGGEPDPHRPLPRRRDLHDRHRRRGDAGALGRRPRDRRGPGHARAAEGLPRHGARPERALEPLARPRRRSATRLPPQA